MTEPRVLAIADIEQGPDEFFALLFKTLRQEKARTHAYGETTVTVKWKNGEPDEVRINDGGTIKFKKK